MRLVARVAIKRLLILTTALMAITLAGAGGYYIHQQADGNFHVVAPGNFYRSRQLSGQELERSIATHRIRSILNLRGPNPGANWYKNEIAVSAARNVAHYDYGISASRRVTPGQLEEILQIIRDAPKPILVHCQEGADRAGLVSAAYLFSRGAGADEARRELSLRYGHFPYLGSATIAMDESFAAYVLGASNVPPRLYSWGTRTPTGKENPR